MVTQHIKLESLQIDKSVCKYTAKLLHTKSVFGKVVSSNNITVCGFATTSVVSVHGDVGVVSDKPICRKYVLKAVEEQHKVFM